MKDPKCQSSHMSKNGITRGKQNYRGVDCSRQSVENPKPHRGYSDELQTFVGSKETKSGSGQQSTTSSLES